MYFLIKRLPSCIRFYPCFHRPSSETQLLQQAQRLAGFSLGELAAMAGLPIPQDLKRDKGWIGMLLELWLGASAGSKPEQDFAALGVELKTIPIDSLASPWKRHSSALHR